MEEESFQIIRSITQYEIECRNGHRMIINEDDFPEAKCKECQKKEKTKLCNPIIQKIKNDEDISLEEFTNLMKRKRIHLKYKLYHHCHKCTADLIHVHYKDKCFNRSKTRYLYSGDVEEEEWEEQEATQTCGMSDEIVEPYYLEDIITY